MRRNLTELRMPVRPWRCGIRYHEIVNHPTFIPSALVVDDKQRRDVREDVQKCFRVTRVGGQPWLELENHADGSECWQAAVASRDGELCGIVDAGKDLRKDVGFEALRVEQIILNQLPRLVRFGKYLHRQKGVRTVRQLREPVLERVGKLGYVAASADRKAICRRVRIGVAGRQWLLGVRVL